MHFSVISSGSTLGRILRLPLRLVPRSARVPILQGPARGMRWIVGSGDHGCWIGNFERPKRRVFEKIVPRGGVVLDIGANVGYYTLAASALVGDAGEVIAFEPLPANLHFLRDHLRMNGLANVRVIDAAVADCDGEVRFQVGASRAMGHIAPEGIPVRSSRLDTLLADGEIPAPDVVKIDVEGAELRVLHGAKRLLEDCRPAIFLATHGQAIQEQCVELLLAHGYQLHILPGQGDELLATPSSL